MRMVCSKPLGHIHSPVCHIAHIVIHRPNLLMREYGVESTSLTFVNVPFGPEKALASDSFVQGARDRRLRIIVGPLLLGGGGSSTRLQRPRSARCTYLRVQVVQSARISDHELEHA